MLTEIYHLNNIQRLDSITQVRKKATFQICSYKKNDSLQFLSQEIIRKQL